MRRLVVGAMLVCIAAPPGPRTSLRIDTRYLQAFRRTATSSTRRASRWR